jgi:O-antigen/teichoic acid export membrane protein
VGKISRLMSDTAVYGLGTMIPRLLNYGVLTPYYTRKFLQADYGIITELYAYVVVLQVVLTYGMETGYFRFSTDKTKENNVYSTIILALLVSSIAFILIMSVLAQPIAEFLDYSRHKEYIIWFSWIIAIDAFTSIPFAKLRRENKAFRFSMIKIANVVISILMVFFFYEVYPHLKGISKIMDVRFVFISNLIASSITLLLLWKEIFQAKFKFDKVVFRTLMIYSIPLLIGGLSGSINEALDRILLKHLLPSSVNAMAQLGIYGANYKIAVFMTLFIQMFRYAADPFFFANMDNKDAKSLYSRVMNYFVLFCSLIFLGIMVNIDVAKFFIGRRFHEGLSIVPIVLLANLLLGVYLNLSIWYKLNNKTLYGAYFMGFGALLTILLNIVLVPKIGYSGAAWTHLIVYILMVGLSYFYGQKQYAIPYQVGKILTYILVPVILVILLKYIVFNSIILKLILGNIVLVLFMIYALKTENVFKEIKFKATEAWFRLK